MEEPRVLPEILQAFEQGKTIRVMIKFGTLKGHFIVDSIEPEQKQEQWVFRGGVFELRTGRYRFYAKEERDDVIAYIFSSNLEKHPRKTIIFEVIA